MCSGVSPTQLVPLSIMIESKKGYFLMIGPFALTPVINLSSMQKGQSQTKICHALEIGPFALTPTISCLARVNPRGNQGKVIKAEQDKPENPGSSVCAQYCPET